MANPSVLLAGREFTAILTGKIDIRVSDSRADRIAIHVGSGVFFVSPQLIDVNITDEPKRLELPFLDAQAGPDFSRRTR